MLHLRVHIAPRLLILRTPLILIYYGREAEVEDDQQGDRGVGQSGARGFKRKGVRGLNPAFSSCFPRPGGAPEECVPRTRHGTYKSPAQSTAHNVWPCWPEAPPPAGTSRHFRCRATSPRLPGRRGRWPRRTHPCSPGSGLWSQLARQAARRQEAVSEWGPLPRQDVSGLGRRRRGAQVQLGGAVQARWRPGSDPRPQPG